MKKISKSLLIILSFIIIFCTFNNSFVIAGDSSLVTEDFDASFWNPGSAGSGDSKLEDIGKNIIGPIQVIGSLVSVIAIIIIGIRYMLGSVEEKAQYKETLWPYLLGAILVFGITNVLAIVYDIAKSI